jgi:hypothetical protein
MKIMPPSKEMKCLMELRTHTVKSADEGFSIPTFLSETAVGTNIESGEILSRFSRIRKFNRTVISFSFAWTPFHCLRIFHCSAREIALQEPTGNLGNSTPCEV